MDDVFYRLFVAGTYRIGRGLTRRNDWNADGTLGYSGVAPVGSATSDATWTVWKYTYDANGRETYVQQSNPSFPTAVGVAWDNRATATYFT